MSLLVDFIHQGFAPVFEKHALLKLGPDDVLHLLWTFLSE